MEKNFEFDVFLSYSSKDDSRVRLVAENLKAEGLKVFFGEDSVGHGEDIYLAVERGLQRSRVFLLFLSPSALESKWVDLERSTALYRDPTNESGRFVPVLLEDCTIPETLERYRRIDYRAQTKEAWEALLAAARGETLPSSRPGADPGGLKHPRKAFLAAGGLLAGLVSIVLIFGPTAIHPPVELHPFEVRGQVRYETGQPFAGAAIHLRDRETQTGTDGSFALSIPRDWIEEDLSLQVTAPGFVMWRGKVVPGSNEIDVILEREMP